MKEAYLHLQNYSVPVLDLKSNSSTQEKHLNSFPNYATAYHLGSLLNFSTVDLPPLHEFWIRDKYDNYFTDAISMRCSNVTQKLEGLCFLFSRFKKQYILLSFLHTGLSKSWNEASELCREWGAHLPAFKNREDLDELIIFLQEIDDKLPPIEGLYIGLKIYPNQVSLNVLPFLFVSISFFFDIDKALV